MSIMTDALTTLGANLPLVAVGCAEALAAAALAGKALMLRGRSRPGAGLVSSVQDRDIQRTMMLENGEVSIVLRREDMVSLAKSRLDRNSEALQYLDKADELSDHLLALINDILDMSRIEAGKVELEKKTFSLRELGNRLYDMFAKQLQERGIHYEVNLEDMTIDSVEGDELRISQVIINFLSNAVKFTSRGEIIVTIRQMMLQDNAADLMFRVHDTGIGMEHEFLNRIFRPFEQESIETGKKFGGTGLGMAITDQLVRLMGGEIVVDSARGKGSDFTVFLHLPVAEKAAASSAAVPAKEPQQPYRYSRFRRTPLSRTNGCPSRAA